MTGGSDVITARHLPCNALLPARRALSVSVSIRALRLWHPAEWMSRPPPTPPPWPPLCRWLAWAVFMCVSPDVDSTIEQMTDLAGSWGDKSTVLRSAGSRVAFPCACFVYIHLSSVSSTLFPHSHLTSGLMYSSHTSTARIWIINKCVKLQSQMIIRGLQTKTCGERYVWGCVISSKQAELWRFPQEK